MGKELQSLTTPPPGVVILTREIRPLNELLESPILITDAVERSKAVAWLSSVKEEKDEPQKKIPDDDF